MTVGSHSDTQRVILDHMRTIREQERELENLRRWVAKHKQHYPRIRIVAEDNKRLQKQNAVLLQQQFALKREAAKWREAYLKLKERTDDKQ
jgi:uncharacterized coiled-coil protein SlyX